MVDGCAQDPGPPSPRSRKAASSTVRRDGAQGRERPPRSAALGQCGTRPGVGRKPTTLQKLPGLRSDAARSRAVGEGQHAGRTPRQPRRRKIRPQLLAKVVRVQRRAEHRVEGVAAGGELRQCWSCPMRDRPGRREPVDDARGSACGTWSLVHRRARRSCGSRGWGRSCPCRRSAGRRTGRLGLHPGRASRRLSSPLSAPASGRKVTSALTLGLRRSTCAMKRPHDFGRGNLPCPEQGARASLRGVKQSSRSGSWARLTSSTMSYCS